MTTAFALNAEQIAQLAESLTHVTDAQLEQSLLAMDAGHPLEALLLAELDRRMEAPAPPAPVAPVAPRATADHGIEEWEPRPAVAPVARLAIEDAGVYVLPDGAVVKVQANKEKTRTYAKRWTPSRQDRLMEAGQHEHGEYVFEAGLVDVVARTGRKMTLEEAKAHSIRYAQCVRCGRKLTDGKSVEQGMGPVCVRYFA